MILGGVAVSSILLTVLLATATTPGQARDQRAIPTLPPPTTTVVEGSRAGVVAVPEGAIARDAGGRSWVSVQTDDGFRKVEVNEVATGRMGLIEVRGAGLQVGDMVELIAADDAVAPPRAAAFRDAARRVTA